MAKKIRSSIEQLEEELRVSQSKLAEEQYRGRQIIELQTRIIEALALAIEAKDQTTLDHLHRVRVYSVEIGKRLGLSESELEALKIAALLHDIGKLAVPEHIISKPGRLTREEFEKMKIHPIVGAEILERVQFPYPVVPIVRSHHERWDGAGYPDGLQGEQIPIGARILSAVDTLDALGSDRQYRKALPLHDAMERIEQESGKIFDPQIVGLLKNYYLELEELARSRAEIVRQQSPFTDLHFSTDQKVKLELVPSDSTESPLSPGRTAFLSSIAAARQEAQTLFELSHDLGNSLSLDETLSVFAVRLKRLVPFDSMATYILHGEVLLPEYVTGDNFRVLSLLRIPLGQGISGWVAQNRKSMVNGNPLLEPGYINDAERFNSLRSAISVPLEGLQGVVGVMTLYNADPDAYTSDHLRILMAISSKIALSVENALAFQEAESSATTDYLTGLYNLPTFLKSLDWELQRCNRLGGILYIVIVKMQGFERMRMQFGWTRMEEAFRLMAGELQRFCREYEYLAKVGHEDFAFILRPLEDQALNQRLIQLTTAIQDFCIKNFKESLFAVSIGYSNSSVDGATADELFICADKRRAMKFSVSIYTGDKHKNRPISAFLCHSSSDKAAVRTLYDRLSLDGIDAWLDEKKLLLGQDWRSEIEKAVRSTDVVIVCLSESSITKEGFVQKEIKFALDVAEEKPFGTIFLIPVKLTQCEVPARLASWQWVSLSSEDGYESLLCALSSRAEALTIHAQTAK